MTVYKLYGENAPTASARVMALGFFDGIHLGHRAIFAEAKKRAEGCGIPFCVFTFEAENNAIKSDTGRLYSTETKLSILEELGIDEVIIADFSRLCDMPAESFVSSLLVGECGARIAVCGEDFRFGKGRGGNFSLLSRLMREAGGDAVAVKDCLFDGEKVSTSLIKRLLKEGNVRRANALLGRPLSVDATVLGGRGVGRTLGFPTVNFELGSLGALLRRGVYRTEIKIGGAHYPALTNIGVCPTFDEKISLHAETHILDFSGDLYGESLTLTFRDFLRDEKRFKSEKELKMQIKVDINTIKSQNSPSHSDGEICKRGE